MSFTDRDDYEQSLADHHALLDQPSRRWNELTGNERFLFNLAVNTVASGGQINRIDVEQFTIIGYRDLEE